MSSGYPQTCARYGTRGFNKGSLRIGNLREHEKTWIDDLHLLPFDGICDWQFAAERLRDFNGPLMFELTTQSKPGRHDNDKYARISAVAYIAEAYGRACRFASLVEKARKQDNKIKEYSES